VGTTSWPPTGQDFFLRPASAHRPLFQGDVYEDVPFVKATYGGDPSRPPGTSIERRAVAVLGYPCDLFTDGRPVKVQTVAPIVNAEKVGIPESWAGAYTYVPLPDLYGDGVMWAVALQAAANIDARYLRRDQRTAALSELGWALFRQRLALRDARALLRVDELQAGGAPLWRELELWTTWNEHAKQLGHDEPSFQSWLDECEPALGGFTRRQALERNMYGTVLESLRRRLVA
jgi:hypothetical protein